MKASRAQQVAGASLLLVDMLLNLVIMIVVIENIVATKNRIQITAVSPIRTVHFLVHATIELQSAERALALHAYDRQPTIAFYLTAPGGRKSRVDTSSGAVAGAAYGELIDFDRSTIAQNRILITGSLFLVAPLPGDWLLEAAIADEFFWRDAAAGAIHSAPGTGLTLIAHQLEPISQSGQGLGELRSFMTKEDRHYLFSQSLTFTVPANE